MTLRVIEHRQLLYIVSMFLIVQFAGLLLATQVFSGQSFEVLRASQAGTSAYGVIFYIGFIILASVLLVLVLRAYKGAWLYRVIDAAVVFLPSLFFFMVVIAAAYGNAFGALFGNGPSAGAFAVAAVLSAGLVVAKMRNPGLRNATTMISTVGVGLVVGAVFSFGFALAFMVVLAVYDFVAVFVTKHMVALGNVAVEKNLSLMIMASEIEAVPVRRLGDREMAEYRKARPELVSRGGITRRLVRSGMAPLSSMTALGNGDMAVPLIVAVAAYKIYLSFVLSFVVVLGALLGLAITMYVLRRYKRPLPAIPFLLAGIGIALGIFIAVNAVTAVFL